MDLLIPKNKNKFKVIYKKILFKKKLTQNKNLLKNNNFK